jgi:hypothetical protein
LEALRREKNLPGGMRKAAVVAPYEVAVAGRDQLDALTPPSASALAATGAMRFEGMKTPAHNLMREVFIAGRAHGDQKIGTEHLGIVEQGVCETQFLSALDDHPRVRLGW